MKKLLIVATFVALLTGGGLALASPASAAGEPCVPVAYQPAVAPTYANQVVTPYQPAVYEIIQTQYQHVVVEAKPAVPAVYDIVVEGIYRDPSGVLPDQFSRSDPGSPWVYVGSGIISTLRTPAVPAVDEVVETRIIETRELVSPEVLEVRADVEVTPGSPEVPAVVCTGLGIPQPELPQPGTPIVTPDMAAPVAPAVGEVSHQNPVQHISEPKQLARTGANSMLPLTLAGLFLLTAGGVVIAARGRRS